jgi:hypothetical protein
VPLCAVAATVLGLIAKALVGHLSIVVRVIVPTGVILVASGFLLAYTQDLSLRGALKSLKGGTPPPAPPIPAD